MRDRIRKHTISFKHAFDGVVWALKTQPNYQIHAILSLVALYGAYLFQISRTELIIIISLITTGFVIETVNTSLERAADAIDTSWREELKQTKDTAAGAMLIFAIGAVIIAGIIFIPRILS